MSLLKAVFSNFYLLLLTLLFYRNSVVVLVVCRSTERTHTCLIISTEQLQRSLMFLTYIVLQITHRIHQFVFLQTCHSQMRLQMSFTVRALTHQTRLQGFQLSFLTDVTQNFSCFLRTFLFTVIYELTECGINLEIRSLLECFFTVWTAAGLAVVPALIQTGLAEVVSTWSRDWISEHVQTYRALNLFSQ